MCRRIAKRRQRRGRRCGRRRGSCDAERGKVGRGPTVVVVVVAADATWSCISTSSAHDRARRESGCRRRNCNERAIGIFHHGDVHHLLRVSNTRTAASTARGTALLLLLELQEALLQQRLLLQLQLMLVLLVLLLLMQQHTQVLLKMLRVRTVRLRIGMGGSGSGGSMRIRRCTDWRKKC